MMLFFEGFLMFDRSIRFPKTNDKPPNKIDLPAPVSPVMVVNPELKST
jgi:hypothetical protein